MSLFLFRWRAPVRGLSVMLLVLMGAVPTLGQQQPPAPAASQAARDVMPFSPALLLPTDPALTKKFDAVREYSATHSWQETIRLLQSLLEMPEDLFVTLRRPGPEGKETVRLVGARAEAERLIASLPRPGLAVYETVCGPRARELLAAARHDPQALAVVAQRYLHTAAGAEAAARLGTFHLDRGRYALAAGYFERALRSAAVEKPDPLLLFQAALAAHRAGDEPKGAALWKRLSAGAGNVLHFGDQILNLDDLESELRRPVPRAAGAGDWPVFGGDAARSATSSSASFPLQVRWQARTLEGSAAAAWVCAAVRQVEAASMPLLPASFPVTSGGKVVFRSERGVEAVDGQTGELLWRWESEHSLDALARSPALHGPALEWVNSYLSNHPQALVENSVLGSLSTDGTRVYAVEDLPVPPFPTPYYSFALRVSQGLPLPWEADLGDAVFHSRLAAIDLASGKEAWSVGSRAAEGDRSLLSGAFFLGPPLPLEGRLYVPVERDAELYLACLEPATGGLLWRQRLASFKGRLAQDGGRRLHALHLAHANGIIVCPTNAGGVIALDLVSRALAWAHAYREAPPPPPEVVLPGRARGRWSRNLPQAPPNLTAEWKSPAPVVQDGKVILPSADSGGLVCVTLRDGAPLWKGERQDGDLFLAGVFGGKVIVVGRNAVRALSLAEGKPLWQCETATPTGRGTAVGGVYYLPVQAAEDRSKPEVWSIELDTGRVVARVGSPNKETVGNLVVSGGMLLSQTAAGVTAYATSSGNKP